MAQVEGSYSICWNNEMGLQKSFSSMWLSESKSKELNNTQTTAHPTFPSCFNYTLAEGFQSNSTWNFNTKANAILMTSPKLNKMGSLKKQLETKHLNNYDFKIRLTCESFTVETTPFKIVSNCTFSTSKKPLSAIQVTKFVPCTGGRC